MTNKINKSLVRVTKKKKSQNLIKGHGPTDPKII